MQLKKSKYNKIKRKWNEIKIKYRWNRRDASESVSKRRFREFGKSGKTRARRREASVCVRGRAKPRSFVPEECEGTRASRTRDIHPPSVLGEGEVRKDVCSKDTHLYKNVFLEPVAPKLAFLFFFPDTLLFRRLRNTWKKKHNVLYI